jgi:hypothetical protein
MSGKLLLFILAAGLALCPLARGDFKNAATTQNTGGAVPKQDEAPLTNKDVLQMISMGLSEGVILDKIHAAKTTNFDISINALKSLKDAKVPDAVMQAMIQATSAAQASHEHAAPNPDDPASPHNAGVWVLVNGKMTEIDASSFSGQKMGMGSMFTMGMKKSHTKATLRNAHAVLQLANPNPEFYFYFEKSAAAPVFSFTGPAPTSPSGYQLVRLETKRDSRETVLMSMGGAMMGGGQVYDFGVSAGSK